jgi:hypothetical protein
MTTPADRSKQRSTLSPWAIGLALGAAAGAWWVWEYLSGVVR